MVVGGGGGVVVESEFSVQLWSKASAQVWTKLNKRLSMTNLCLLLKAKPFARPFIENVEMTETLSSS